MVRLRTKGKHPFDLVCIIFGGTDFNFRWADGRKYWAQLVQTSRNMARLIWVHTDEREGEMGKVDLLRKLYAERCS